MSSFNKVIVIGKGRFGNAASQGLRKGFIEMEGGKQVKCNVVQVSATRFCNLSISEMAQEFEDTAFVAYCGTRLSEYAGRMAMAIQHAAKRSSGPPLEFIDFSNPDPGTEKADVSGTLDLWAALNTQTDEEERSKGSAVIKVWKITEVGSVDVSGIVSNTDGLVYSSSPGSVPRITIPNLALKAAPGPNGDLFEEARKRIMERAGIDCWWDANMMGLAVFAFTSMYAILRYNVNVNGSEPHSNIVMYLLDKAYAWTGLWMMVVSPFAGNLLALGSIYQKWSEINFFQKIVTLLCSLLMIIPTILFSFCWALWVMARNLTFMYRWPIGVMYLSQSPDTQHKRREYWIKSSLVDMVNMKGETGCVGFIYAFIHSFLGCIICDIAYKGYWFEDNGRLGWRFELSMMTGCVSTCVLWIVTMRSIMGKASWIRLKPLYAYLSPIGIWFAVVHVMAFGAKGWNTLFNKNYHNGQMSITFVSSMFPACILLVHHIMSIFGTKKACSGDHLWNHSMVNIATIHYERMVARVADVCPDLRFVSEKFASEDSYSEGRPAKSLGGDSTDSSGDAPMISIIRNDSF